MKNHYEISLTSLNHHPPAVAGLDVHLSHHCSQCSHRVAGRPSVAHRPGRTGRGAAALGSFAARIGGWVTWVTWDGLDVE